MRRPSRAVFFFDEGRFGLQPCTGKCWARYGKDPVAPLLPGYKNFYIYSAVNPFDGDHFTLFLPWVNTEMMGIYLRELSREYHGHELMLVMDQAGWHKANDLYVPGNVSICFLPSHSPELNPVERLWHWMRRHVCRNRLFHDLDDLESSLIAELNSFNNQFLSTLCGCRYLLNIN